MDLNLEVLLQFIMSMWGDRAEAMAQQFLGRPSLGRNILSNNAEKTMAYNAYMSDRARMLNGLSGIRDQLALDATRNMFGNLGGLFGNPAAGKSYADSFVGTLVSNLMFAPKFGAASAAFGQAVYGQQYLWDWRVGTAGVTPGTAANFFNNTGALFQSVMTDAINGGIGGLGIVDSGKLLAAYTRMGGANNMALADNAAGTATKQRIERIKTDLREYASAVNALQDVIDGPMEEILARFEELTGNNMMSMASGRAASVSNTLRNILMTGNISVKSIGAMAQLQSGLLAPLGYTTAQSSQLAIANAALLATGVKVEGLNDKELAVALAQDTAQRAVRGEDRIVAAAYVDFRQKKGLEDDAFAQDLFRRTMTKNGKVDIVEAAQQYISKNNISSSFMHSAVVNNTLGNPMFAAELRRADAQKFFDWQNNELKGIVSDEALAEISKTYDPAQIQEILARELKDPRRAAEIVERMTYQAQMISGSADERTAWAILGKSREGAILAQRDLLSRNFTLMGNVKSAKGMEGVINMLARGGENAKNAQNVAALVSAYIGLDPSVSAELSTNLQKYLQRQEGETDDAYYKRVIGEIQGLVGNDKNLAGFQEFLMAGARDPALAGTIWSLASNSGMEEEGRRLLGVISSNKLGSAEDLKYIRDKGKSLGLQQAEIDRLAYKVRTGKWRETEDWNKIYTAAGDFAKTKFDEVAAALTKEELGGLDPNASWNELSDKDRQRRLDLSLEYADRLHFARTAVNALRTHGDGSDEAMKTRVVDKGTGLNLDTLLAMAEEHGEISLANFSKEGRDVLRTLGVKDGEGVTAQHIKMLQAAIKDDSVAGILRNILSLLERFLNSLGGGKTP